MLSFRENGEERDNALAERSAFTVETISFYFRNWIEEELRDLAPWAEAIKATGSEIDKGRAEEASRIIRDIDRYELYETLERMKERVKDIRGGGYKSPLDAHLYLLDSFGGVERLVRKILRIRWNLDDMWSDEEKSGDNNGAGGNV